MEKQTSAQSINEGLSEYTDAYGDKNEERRQQALKRIKQNGQDFANQLHNTASALQEQLKNSNDLYTQIKDIVDIREFFAKFPKKEDRRVAFDVLKEVWKKRIEGMGAIREHLLSYLHTAPDASREDIFLEAQKISSEYTIPAPLLHKALDPIIDNYLQRRIVIRNMTDDILIKTLQKYGYEFDASIAAIKRHAFDIEVYGPVKYEGAIDPSTSGFTYKGYPFSVNANKEESTRVHEEQHNIHEMLPYEKGVFLSSHLEEALNCAKDEILAQYRGSEEAWFMIPHILSPRSTFPNEKTYEKIWKNLNERDSHRYADIINQATATLKQMSTLYSKEATIGMLQSIDLDKWKSFLAKIEKEHPNASDTLQKKIETIEKIIQKL